MAKGAVIARIISEYSDKGTKAAVKDLEKTGDKFKDFSSKVGKAFAVAAAASAAFAIKIGVDAVKAAMEEQQQMALLANTLHNTTGANEEAIKSVERYIKATELRLGVQDTQLIPSLRSLLVATQDVSKAEALQGLALDISASKGKDLGEVSVALAKAYLGNFNALKRMGVPLSEAIIKNKDFAAAVKELTAAFGGSAAVAADTFEGRITRIGLAFEEVKKTIGNAIIVALQPFLDKFLGALPQIEKWLDDNAKKIAGFFITGISYAVAFGQTVYDIFNFVSRNIKVFAEIGAVIVAAWAGAKVASAASAIITTVQTIIKVMKALRTASLGAAFAEAVATGGVAAAAGIAAAIPAFMLVNQAMNKFEKDAQKAAKGAGDLKFNFKGLSVSAADYLKGLGKIDNTTKTTTNSTKNLTAEQKKALDLLKQLGIVPTTSTDTIELEAARLNLLKQRNVEEQIRLNQIVAAYEAQFKANEETARYNDLLTVIADKTISSEEIAVLSKKWGMSVDAVNSYIAVLFAVADKKISKDEVDLLATAWGITKDQAQKYLDFFSALNDGKLSDTEIQNLGTKWGMTRQEVLQYADFILKLSDYKLDDAEIKKLQDRWGLTIEQVVDYVKKIGTPATYDSSLVDPALAAKTAWTNAKTALDLYIEGLGTAKAAADALAEANRAATEASNAAAAAAAAAAKAAADAAAAAAKTATPVVPTPSPGVVVPTPVVPTVPTPTVPTPVTPTPPEEPWPGFINIASLTSSNIGNLAAALGTNSVTGGAAGAASSATAGTTIIVQGNVITQADNVAAIRNDLLNAQLSGKPITTRSVAL